MAIGRSSSALCRRREGCGSRDEQERRARNAPGIAKLHGVIGIPRFLMSLAAPFEEGNRQVVEIRTPVSPSSAVCTGSVGTALLAQAGDTHFPFSHAVRSLRASGDTFGKSSN